VRHGTPNVKNEIAVAAKSRSIHIGLGLAIGAASS
jgi:hypothetical protein